MVSVSPPPGPPALGRRAMMLGAAAGLALAPAARAAVSSPPQRPRGPVLLTVDGRHAAPGLGFDRAMLEALPQERFVTTTIWTTGRHTFSGPALRSVLDAAGVPPGTGVALSALNDYRIPIGPAMIEPRVPIVATRMDGAPFGARDKGPLWLVWPYDAADRYRSEEIFARSVWQLIAITTGP